MKTISVVTPCYNEEENIEECYQTIKCIFSRHMDSLARQAANLLDP